MNGFICKSVAMACLAACVPILGGCQCYRDIVDPCWPERYNAVARHNLNDIFDGQALNGHILDQTIWNYHFTTCLTEVPDPTICKTEDGKQKNVKMKVLLPSAQLNEAGKLQLLYLVRRLPVPDGKIYLATARDLPIGTPVKEIAEKTNDLNSRRIAAIHEYLAAITAGYQRFPVSFEVAIHDRPQPTYPALPVSGAMRPSPTGVIPDLYNQYMGSIPQNQLSGMMTGGGGAP